MQAVRNFGQSGDAGQTATLLGKGWEPTATTPQRGMFRLQGETSSQYAVLDRLGGMPGSVALVSEYTFDKGKIQHFAAGMYSLATDSIMIPTGAIKVKSETPLQYSVNQLA